MDTAVADLEVRLLYVAGFRNNPRVVNPEIDAYAQGFYIDEYHLDMDNWEGGFITQ